VLSIKRSAPGLSSGQKTANFTGDLKPQGTQATIRPSSDDQVGSG